eukprot:10117515-Alexandrium_andersonii.AAC.1
MLLRNAVSSQSNHCVSQPRATAKSRKTWKATSDTAGASVLCPPALGARWLLEHRTPSPGALA